MCYISAYRTKVSALRTASVMVVVVAAAAVGVVVVMGQ
jgi:hypothetical protein